MTEHRAVAPALRPAADRPSLHVVLWRVVFVTLAGALTLWLLAAVLDGFTIDEWWQALLAGFVVGVVNAVVWPALAFVVVPISVLTLGIGAIVARRPPRPARARPAAGRHALWVLDGAGDRLSGWRP